MTDDLPSALVFEMLSDLEREVGATVGTVDALARARPADAGIANLRSSVVLALSKIELLRSRSLELVETSNARAWREASLRARTNVVMASLASLAKVALPPRMFGGRFPTLASVEDYLLGRIAAINIRWQRERISLEQADAAMSMIGDGDADLERFLRGGAQSGRRTIRFACREIATVVNLDLSRRLRA